MASANLTARDIDRSDGVYAQLMIEDRQSATAARTKALGERPLWGNVQDNRRKGQPMGLSAILIATALSLTMLVAVADLS
jgi:hypothetical protein